jgi:N-acetylglutamate synthase and related acetyltransferases
MEKDFIRLNENWIKTYFRLEESDIKTLSNPKKIIDKGGQIFFAINEDAQKVIGCCALIRHSAETWELAKMAVDPDAQSHGAGFLLGSAIISEARHRGAKLLFLEGNTRMEASIHLYRKLGFTETEIDQAAYERCNIKMVIRL